MEKVITGTVYVCPDLSRGALSSELAKDRFMHGLAAATSGYARVWSSTTPGVVVPPEGVPADVGVFARLGISLYECVNGSKPLYIGPECLLLSIAFPRTNGSLGGGDIGKAVNEVVVAAVRRAGVRGAYCDQGGVLSGDRFIAKILKTDGAAYLYQAMVYRTDVSPAVLSFLRTIGRLRDGVQPVTSLRREKAVYEVEPVKQYLIRSLYETLDDGGFKFEIVPAVNYFSFLEEKGGKRSRFPGGLDMAA